MKTHHWPIGLLALLASGGAQAQGQAQAQATATTDCELHVWPTDNHLGVQKGGLAAFGLIGAAINHAVNKDRVATIKELMHDTLDPDAQIDELRKSNVAETLGLSGYRIVVEPATLSTDAIKGNPAATAQVKAMQAKLRNGTRLSNATTPCYAELVGTEILYQKAMMYGSNLFAKWTFRDFGKDGTGKPRTFNGSVKNPLENFPARTPEMADAARIEIRDA